MKTSKNINWESELASLLDRLAIAQEQLLALLSKKHDLLMQRDHAGLEVLAPEELRLCQELQACHESRQLLLSQAVDAGLPADSISSLTSALSQDQQKTLHQSLEDANQRSKLLRHQSLSQWVVVQRTLLHLSHMIEIIATGGHIQPTYGKDGSTHCSGSLMDQAV